MVQTFFWKHIIFLGVVFIGLTGCQQQSHVMVLGADSPHTWVYLGGLAHDFNADHEIENRQILDRLGKDLNIKFLALHPFDRCEKADNQLCWLNYTDGQTIETYRKICSALNNERISGFIGFSNGGFFLNHLAQIHELKCPIISVGAAGSCFSFPVRNTMTLIVGKEECIYGSAIKFHEQAQAKESLLATTLVVHEGGHILPEKALAKCLTDARDQ